MNDKIMIKSRSLQTCLSRIVHQVWISTMFKKLLNYKWVFFGVSIIITVKSILKRVLAVSAFRIDICATGDQKPNGLVIIQVCGEDQSGWIIIFS